MKVELEGLIAGTFDADTARAALLNLNDNLSAENLALCVQILKQHQRPFTLEVPSMVFDVCGTGGDKARVGNSTFNISTAVAFVLSACDVPVIKHANRAASSLAGSVDVLDCLGVPAQLDDKAAQKCLNENGLLFLNAGYYYPSLKILAPIRKALGVPTIFNLAGPIANPAPVTHRVTGCFASDKAALMAAALQNLGQPHFAILYADDGLDEISPASSTTIITQSGAIVLSPEDFGLKRFDLSKIAGGDATKNARIIEDILAGIKGPPRDVVVLNAAFALHCAGQSLKDAVVCANRALDTGAAQKKLKAMRSYV